MQRRRDYSEPFDVDSGVRLQSLGAKKPVRAPAFLSFAERRGLLAPVALMIPQGEGLERQQSRTSFACSFFGTQRLSEASFLRRQKPKSRCSRTGFSLVERPGFEPGLPSRVNTLSKRAP